MLYSLDLFGTFIFAITGAFRGIKHELDILGILILSLITGLGGGIIRDIILGDNPPAAFKDENYFLVTIIAGLLSFFFSVHIAKRWNIVQYADAIGLAVFTVIGSIKGFNNNLGIFGVVFTGVVTATGGGVLRDILVSEIPSILKTEFYATAAIIGGLISFVLLKNSIDINFVMLITFIVTLLLRINAMNSKYSLPKVKKLPSSPSIMTKEYNEYKKNRK